MNIEEIRKYAKEWSELHVGVDPTYEMNCILALIKELDEINDEFNTLTRIYSPKPSATIIEEYYHLPDGGDFYGVTISGLSGGGGSGKTNKKD